MNTIPLISALSNHIGCETRKLAEYLNNPQAHKKAAEFLRGKRLQTTYKDKEGVQKEITFGNISLKSVCEIDAFEGYLGISLLLLTSFINDRCQTSSILLR